MALVVNDRVKETSTTTGTGTFDLAGAATGFQTFVAGVGDTNTTYYAIFNQGTTEWEVGLGTVTDAATDTLARTTLISSSTGSAVSFTSGTKDVFCTLPASKAVFGKQEGTNFSNSLLVGTTTTGTLNNAFSNVGVGISSLGSLTEGDDNTCVGFISGNTLTTGDSNTFVGKEAGRYCQTGGRNTLIGDQAGTLVTGDFNTCIGNEAGENITSADGCVIIGNVLADSATTNHQLKITGNDDATSVTWIAGDSSGNITVPGTVTASGSVLATLGDVTALAVALG